MTPALYLVVVFSAVALGLSAFALYVSWSARGTAREAHGAVRSLASAVARRKREQREQVDEREVDLGPPAPVEERRQEDLGPVGRHRPPGERYPRLRESADAREQHEDATTAIPRVDPHATVEHPAPSDRFRRPPPSLPPPGAITRPRP